MRSIFTGCIALALVACGGGGASPAVCDKLETSHANAQAKAAPCAATPYTPPALTVSVATCRATIDKCSPSDAQHFTDVAECLDALPTCSASLTWGPAYDACNAKFGPLVGQGC